MVESCGSKPDLRDLEALPLFAKQVRSGHADLVQGEFTDRSGVVLATHPAQRANQTNAGRVHRHDHAGMATGAVSIRIGDTEDDQKRAERMRGASDEPFTPRDDVVIAI